MSLVEASIEGPIQSVASDGAGGAVIVSMGVNIRYTPGDELIDPPDTSVPPAPVRKKSIRTPTQRLSVDQLISKAAFPGRNNLEGFVGGTIIAEGFYSTDNVNGVNVFIANHITVEPAETVLIGAVTANDGSNISLNTTKIVPLTDSRLSTNPDDPSSPLYLNDSGFPITLASIAVAPSTPNPPPPATPPAPSSAEGYFAEGEFHAFRIEYGSPGLLAPNTPPGTPPGFPRVSIERANVGNDGTSFDIEVRGFISAPPPLPTTNHVLEFRVLDMKSGTLGLKPTDWEYRGGSEAAANITAIGTLRVDLRTTGGNPIAQVPPVQRWRFRGVLPKTGVHLLPPERIEVRNVTAETALHQPVREISDTDVK